jgi:hypothetical protein
MKSSVEEQLLKLTDRSRAILRTAATVESDERKFISLCTVYFPEISDLQARELKRLLCTENR